MDATDSVGLGVYFAVSVPFCGQAQKLTELWSHTVNTSINGTPLCMFVCLSPGQCVSTRRVFINPHLCPVPSLHPSTLIDLCISLTQQPFAMAPSLFKDMDPAEDDRPIAVRRKRRLSSGLTDPIVHNSTHQAEASRDTHGNATRTPAKPKKKVRFSDPGPNSSRPSASTGLTPYLRRTSFEPRARDARDSSPPRMQPQAPRRRLSMPALRNALPSPSLSPQPQTVSGAMQYASLRRQMLQPRVKRRLRRNGLSEEANNIEDEVKSKAECLREIEGLREEIASLQEHNRHPDANDADDESNAQRIHELEDELVQLKQERAETPTAESFPRRPVLHDVSGIFLDETAEDFGNEPFETTERLQDLTPVPETPSNNEIATQASIPHPAQQDMLREARLSLEYLFPGEIALGLIPEDPKPLFDVMIERLQRLKTDCLFAEDRLSTTQTQESNLRTQFNAVLEQLNRTRKYSEKLREKNTAERAQVEKAEARIPLMEISTREANEKAEALRKESQEKDRSMKKLQNALESYRTEATKLESLINQQQARHEEAMAAVRMEMDEAVADLECNVAAEELARLEAQREVAERDARIKELQHREKELVATVNEKQEVIREMESRLNKQRTQDDQEVGRLNVQIGTLSSSVDDAVQQQKQAEAARDLAMRTLQDEKNAGLRAIDALRAELDNFTRSTDGIKAAYASDSRRRGAEVAEHKGLLTPVAETRFRDFDVPGYVETARGKGKRKQRPDSGIVILEEDEDESMVDLYDL